MNQNIETYTGFHPDKVGDFFANRGWKVVTMPVVVTNLVQVTKGAALECGDGRFDQLERRKAHGVRILGGVNAVMAMLTGGDGVGFQRATELLQRFNVTPGTHSAEEGGCGYADLWIAGRLESAIYPYELHAERGSQKLGDWLRNRLRVSGGKHFRLNGNHNEQGTRINPFRGYTESVSDGERFRIDDWFMADLGIPDRVRLLKIAETIEQLKPDATNLEILVP